MPRSPASRLQVGERVIVLSGRWTFRHGTFQGWTGRVPCAEVDLEPSGKAPARRVRVTTVGHKRISPLSTCTCPIGTPCACATNTASQPSQGVTE